MALCIVTNILVSEAIIRKNNNVNSNFQENDLEQQKIEVSGFSYDVENFSLSAILNNDLQGISFEEDNEDCKLIREYESKNNINHIEKSPIATVKCDLNNDQNEEIIALISNSYFCGAHENGAILVYEMTVDKTIKKRTKVTSIRSNLNVINETFAVAFYNNQVCAFYIEGKIVFFSLS